jgi:hypothetical protein
MPQQVIEGDKIKRSLLILVFISVCFTCYAAEQSYSLTKDGFEATGLTIPHANVTLVCNGVDVTDTISDEDGRFRLVDNCRPGDEVHLRIEHGGETHETRRIRVKHTLFWHGKQAHGVPEFSLIGGMAAAMATAFGIFMMKKGGGIK